MDWRGKGYIDKNKHEFDTASIDIPLTNDQYNDLIDYIDDSTANSPYYDLIYGVQCTAWALNALSDSNIIPSSLSPNMDISNPIFDIIDTIMYNPYTQTIGFNVYDIVTDLLNTKPITAPLPGIDDLIPFDPNNPPTPPRRDPLVLDTDKDGFISTIALEDSNTYFDITGDGIKEKVSWIGANDGILAYDKNSNGKIDGINEVFGNLTTSGFDELRQLIDSNNDGVIDRRDELFNRLKIWHDNNGDGTVEQGELKSLKDEGVKSINVTNVINTNIELGVA